MKRKTVLQTERHVSSGGLVYCVQGEGVQVVLISRLGGKVWCLPKGRVEKGESFEQAAEREVKEETGLEAKVVQGLGNVQYRYYDKWEKRRIFKTVHFFLLLYLRGDVQNHDCEVDEAHWFPMGEALSLLTYSSEKEIFRKGMKVLEKISA